MLLALSGTFEQLLTYVVFAGWIFYGLGALAVFASRRRSPDAVRPFRTPGYPVTPVLFALAAALIVGNTLFQQTRRRRSGSPWFCSELRSFSSGVRAVAKWNRLSRRESSLDVFTINWRNGCELSLISACVAGS